MREEAGKKKEEKAGQQKKRQKKGKTIEVKRVAEEWENIGQRRRSSKVGGRD